MTDDTPRPDHIAAITAAANEGIPVAACARIFQYPLAVIFDILKDARAQGHITDMPKTDWRPGSSREDHEPAIPVDPDLAFNCGNALRLTRLECGFVVALLRHKHLEKGRLHGIVEHQRLTRPTRPDTLESTDIKMVDVMICKLRKKLKTIDPRFAIATVWGNGYYIEPDVKVLILDFVARASGVSHDKTAEDATPSAAGCPLPKAA